MILNGTHYLKAINDVIALNVGADEIRNALVSLKIGSVPEGACIQLARERLRVALSLIEHEAARVEAECKAWEGSDAAQREAQDHWTIEKLLDQHNGRAAA